VAPRETLLTVLKTRVATEADAEAMQDIYRAASLSNEGDRDDLLSHPEFLILPADLPSSGRAIVTTDDSFGPVAFASLRDINDGVAELDDLFTHPDWRRKNAARLALNALIAGARARGVRRIEVTANVHAMAFYEALQFRRIGTAETELRAAPRLALDIG
jgi:GNAT superfamily N-acetyltransferase